LPDGDSDHALTATVRLRDPPFLGDLIGAIGAARLRRPNKVFDPRARDVRRRRGRACVGALSEKRVGGGFS
jgi:hypothetical protein